MEQIYKKNVKDLGEKGERRSKERELKECIERFEYPPLGVRFSIYHTLPGDPDDLERAVELAEELGYDSSAIVDRYIEAERKYMSLVEEED